MNLGFTYLEDFEELGEAQDRKERPTPTHCSGPLLSPYLASYGPLVLSKAKAYLGKLLQSPKKVLGNVPGLVTSPTSESCP